MFNSLKSDPENTIVKVLKLPKAFDLEKIENINGEDFLEHAVQAHMKEAGVSYEVAV